ncbi:MAG: glycosyltransferase [Candidatus Saccharibacteria bacterium]|nr:glycosyltransferase [Candidatus Saccharibacteria bacterium]
MSELRNPACLRGKKVAIVTDWLTTYGGAEKVVKTVAELYPEAPIFTSQYSEREVNWFCGRDVRTGWVNWLPARLRKILSIPRAMYFSRLKLREFDIIISITTAESKGIKTRPDQLHISYLQGPPTQYFWGMYDEYVKNPGFGAFNPVVRFFFRLLVGPLRKLDYNYAQRPDVLLANSSYSAAEIEKYYHRKATVVFPPVDVDKFRPSDEKDDFFISTSRQVNWKRLDLAVAACLQTGQRLKLVGGGAEHDALVKLASGDENIEFIPTVTNAEELAALVSRAKGFIFPSLEPFGIAPIEALSAGVPVIAYQRGGAMDYIEDGKNGVFFAEQTTASLVEALRRFERMTFDTTTVTQSARRFSTAHFKRQFMSLVRKYDAADK